MISLSFQPQWSKQMGFPILMEVEQTEKGFREQCGLN